jgi:hypothetical protein
MSNFDKRINEIRSDLSILNEVDTTSIGRFFGSLVQGIPGRGGKPITINPLKYKPENVYYLRGGYKSLPILRKQLSKVPIANIAEPMFDPTTGIIKNPKQLAVTIYNAFDTAITMGHNYISLDQLLSGEIFAGKDRKKSFHTLTRKAPIKQQIHINLMKFLYSKQLKSYIYYMTLEEAAEADKGNLIKQAGKAVSQGITQVGKNLASEIVQQATTSQNQGGGGALNI